MKINLPPMPKAAPGFILISLSLCNNRNRQKKSKHLTQKLTLKWSWIGMPGFTYIHEVPHPIVLFTLTAHLLFHLPLTHHLLLSPPAFLLLSVYDRKCSSNAIQIIPLQQWGQMNLFQQTCIHFQLEVKVNMLLSKVSLILKQIFLMKKNIPELHFLPFLHFLTV